jgi:cytochrome c oxidase assembly protein subunit 15
MTDRSWTWAFPVACCLVAATGVLLAFGALVTTYEAAMAVPDWPATYGHNMFLYPLGDWFFGPWDLFLEHGHRLLGATVGAITLFLAAAVWATRQPSAVRALTVAAVLLVVLQGLLGGLRVLLDDKTIAKVHACTGPLFFAVAVGIATLLSPWLRAGSARHPGRAETSSHSVGGWLAGGLLVAAYVQLVAGAQLRHLDATVSYVGFRWLVFLHVAGAVVVTLLSIAAASSAFGLLPRAWQYPVRSTAERWWSLVIVGLVCCQLVLGCLAWVVSWGMPLGLLPDSLVSAFPEPTGLTVARSGFSAAVVTGHVLLGMFILANSVVLAIVSGGIPQIGTLAISSGRRAWV